MATEETVTKGTVTPDGKRLIVESQVREMLQTELGGIRIDGEFMPALNEKVRTLAKEAARRAKSNGRATLRPDDL